MAQPNDQAAVEQAYDVLYSTFHVRNFIEKVASRGITIPEDQLDLALQMGLRLRQEQVAYHEKVAQSQQHNQRTFLHKAASRLGINPGPAQVPAPDEAALWQFAAQQAKHPELQKVAQVLRGGTAQSAGR